MQKYYDGIFQDPVPEMQERLMAPARFVQIKTAQVVGAQPGPVQGTGPTAPAPAALPQANAQPAPPVQGADPQQLLRKTITDLEKSPVVDLFMHQSQPIIPGPKSQEVGNAQAQGAQGPGPQQGQAPQQDQAPATAGATPATAKYAAAEPKVKTPKVPKAPTGAPSAKQTVSSSSPKVTADWSAPSKIRQTLSMVKSKLPRSQGGVSLNAKKQAPYRGRKGSKEE